MEETTECIGIGNFPGDIFADTSGLPIAKSCVNTVYAP